MGHIFRATCRACGHEFRASEGGGRQFVELRCDVCGKSKSVGRKEAAEPFEQRQRDSDALHDLESFLGKTVTGDPDEKDEYISEQVGAAMDQASEKFWRAMEAVAGQCSCGGRFRAGMPIRCPQCRSADIEEGETTRRYF